MIVTTDLIVGAQGGDDVAIAALLTHAQPDIRRYARATCAADDVDDAVQDALCLVHRHIRSLRIVAAFSSWAFAIVKRECIRLARRALAGTIPVETLADDLRMSVRPEHELRIDVAAAIASLPGHYRDIVVMRDLEELTIAEISARVHATKQATKARLHRARALIREYLDES